MQLILATRNPHKLREIEKILGPGFYVSALVGRSDIAEVHESGSSYEENAILKAVTISKQLTGLIVADDSGLEVDALDGQPGIHSARYAGPAASSEKKIATLLGQLAKIGVEDDQRGARFRCVVAVACNGQILAAFEGVVEGKIAEQPRGSRGFGYDPIFIPNGFEETFAELAEDVKNTISHRAKAIRKLQAKLPTLCRKG